MQHLRLGAAGLAAYHRHIQSDHDFRVWAEVLTLSENPVSDVDVLDGQVNINVDADGPDRTATLVLSDPESAIAFGTSVSEDDNGVLWVNRLLRVRHSVDVPDVGEVVSVPFVGVPRSVGRSGAELTLELGDKSVLADHGVREQSFVKGQNAAAAIVTCLQTLTGELHHSIPAHSRKLGRTYSVGMGDGALTPWTCARLIANNELAWRLEYRADGWVVAEPRTNARARVAVDDTYSLPDAQASFDSFVNFTRVTSTREVGKNTETVSATAELPSSHRLSAASLARNGVPRLQPLHVDNPDLIWQSFVNSFASSTLSENSGITNAQSHSVVPMFHLDNEDTIDLPYGLGSISASPSSIPLGVGGAMTVGATKWVSKPVVVKAAAKKKLVVKTPVVK